MNSSQVLYRIFTIVLSYLGYALYYLFSIKLEFYHLWLIFIDIEGNLKKNFYFYFIYFS